MHAAPLKFVRVALSPVWHFRIWTTLRLCNQALTNSVGTEFAGALGSGFRATPHSHPGQAQRSSASPASKTASNECISTTTAIGRSQAKAANSGKAENAAIAGFGPSLRIACLLQSVDQHLTFHISFGLLTANVRHEQMVESDWIPSPAPLASQPPPLNVSCCPNALKTRWNYDPKTRRHFALLMPSVL